jgi:hypothetical protein
MPIEIPFIPGFQQRSFSSGTVPNEKILIELIRPGADPSSVLATSHVVPDFDSQSLLKKLSNWLVNNPIDYTYLKPFCEQFDIDFNELSYYLTLTDYIDYFFLPIPNLNSARTDGVKLKKAVWLAHAEFEENILVDSDKTKEVRERLMLKFPDYKLSDNFISAFYLKLTNDLNGCLEAVENPMLMIEKLNQERLSSYRLPKETRSPSNTRLLQCTYCSNWFEAAIGNGKLSIKCEALSCFREWDRLRRRKENL